LGPLQYPSIAILHWIGGGYASVIAHNAKKQMQMEGIFFDGKIVPVFHQINRQGIFELFHNQV
jgi:hypothetical protein